MRKNCLPIAGSLMILPGVEGIGDSGSWETGDMHNEQKTSESRIGHLTPRQEHFSQECCVLIKRCRVWGILEVETRMQ